MTGKLEEKVSKIESELAKKNEEILDNFDKKNEEILDNFREKISKIESEFKELDDEEEKLKNKILKVEEYEAMQSRFLNNQDDIFDFVINMSANFCYEQLYDFKIEDFFYNFDNFDNFDTEGRFLGNKNFTRQDFHINTEINLRYVKNIEKNVGINIFLEAFWQEKYKCRSDMIDDFIILVMKQIKTNILKYRYNLFCTYVPPNCFKNFIDGFNVMSEVILSRIINLHKISSNVKSGFMLIRISLVALIASISRSIFLHTDLLPQKIDYIKVFIQYILHEILQLLERFVSDYKDKIIKVCDISILSAIAILILDGVSNTVNGEVQEEELKNDRNM